MTVSLYTKYCELTKQKNQKGSHDTTSVVDGDTIEVSIFTQDHERNKELLKKKKEKLNTEGKWSRRHLILGVNPGTETLI